MFRNGNVRMYHKYMPNLREASRPKCNTSNGVAAELRTKTVFDTDVCDIISIAHNKVHDELHDRWCAGKITRTAVTFMQKKNNHSIYI